MPFLNFGGNKNKVVTNKHCNLSDMNFLYEKYEKWVLGSGSTFSKVDLRIRIRINVKMRWIRNAAYRACIKHCFFPENVVIFWILPRADLPSSGPVFEHWHWRKSRIRPVHLYSDDPRVLIIQYINIYETHSWMNTLYYDVCMIKETKLAYTII